MHVSIGKQNIKIIEKLIYFFDTKIVKITKARSFIMERHDHFVLHDLFAKNFACTEAHKNSIMQGKNKKFQNHEGSCMYGHRF